MKRLERSIVKGLIGNMFLDDEVLLVVSKPWFLYVVVVVVDFSVLQTFHEFSLEVLSSIKLAVQLPWVIRDCPF